MKKDEIVTLDHAGHLSSTVSTPTRVREAVETLLPCPFCGGEAIVYDCGRNDWAARCVGECTTYHGQEFGSRKTMAEAWNRRAALSTPTRVQGPEGEPDLTTAHNALNLVDMLLVEAGFQQDSSVRHNLQIAKSVMRDGEKALRTALEEARRDAQAMALVKRFELDIVTRSLDGRRFVHGPDVEVFIKGGDLNRAIVECVAKMQDARSTTKSNPGTDSTEPQDK